METEMKTIALLSLLLLSLSSFAGAINATPFDQNENSYERPDFRGCQLSHLRETRLDNYGNEYPFGPFYLFVVAKAKRVVFDHSNNTAITEYDGIVAVYGDEEGEAFESEQNACKALKELVKQKACISISRECEN
jgi:hypothetical protein